MNAELIGVLVLAASSIAVPIEAICSRRRVWEPWAKVASVVLCLLWLGWAGLALSLIHMAQAVDVVFDPYGIVLTHARIFVAGNGCGLALGLLIARPYKRVTREQTPAAV